MLLSIALLLLLGWGLSLLCQKLRLPGLVGMILAGILLGPSVMNLLSPKLLNIAAELRQIALLIILLRAGLGLNLSELRQVGRPAILLCFVPATFEILGTLWLAPLLFGISYTEAFLLGTVIAAVSPAVVVPQMLRLVGKGYGVKQGVPQMLLAGSSADDIFVLVLFTLGLGLLQQGTFAWTALLHFPTAVVLGILAGWVLGNLLSWFFARFTCRDSHKLILIFCIGFGLVTLDAALPGAIGFSGLLAVITLGISFAHRSPTRAERLAVRCGKLWIVAELLLFGLVGAAVPLKYAWVAGPLTLVLLFGILLHRMLGVALSVSGTSLNRRERTFCVFSYLPKATVQAAIGSIPLAAGLPCGELVLTIAVVSILVTAPIGALLIEQTGPRWLQLDSRAD